MSVDKIATGRIEQFKEIVALNPGDAFARYGLAMEYRQAGQHTLALAEFDELRTRHPDYAPGYQMAAQILIAAGKSEAAQQRLRGGIAAARAADNRHALAEMEGMLDELAQGDR